MPDSPRGYQFNQQELVADIHAHPDLKIHLFDYDLTTDHFTTPDFNPVHMQVDLPKLQRAGVDLVFATAYLPEKRFVDDCSVLSGVNKVLSFYFRKIRNKVEEWSHPERPFEQTIEMLKTFENKVAAVKNYPVMIAKNKAEMKRGLEHGMIVFVHAIEGAHSLGHNLSHAREYLKKLHEFFDRGVCMMTVAHFYENDLSYPLIGIAPGMRKVLNCKQKPDFSKGLTPLGEKIVKEMLEIGMLVDLTHLTPKGRARIYEINRNCGSKKRPLIFSHCGITRLFNVAMNPDENEIKEIADCNGVIGIIFNNYWLFGLQERFLQYNPALSYIIRTVEEIKQITGTYDNIAIGSDYDGFTDPPDDLRDISKMPRVSQALLDYGISYEDVKKIMGQNARRVLETGWDK